MTREDYLKHKEVFEWFMAEPNRSVVYSTNGGKNWHSATNPNWSFHNIYIPNDEYVEFRKAIVEGKTIQWDKNFIIKKSHSHYVDIKGPIKSYLPSILRIKPDKPEFKVGDWVRHCKGNIFKIKRIDKHVFHICSNISGERYKINELELWQPQEDNIVVYWDNKNTDRYIGKYGKMLSEQFDNIIPYIGQPFEEMK